MQYKCQYQVASFKQQAGSLLANIMDLNLQLQLINYLTFDDIQCKTIFTSHRSCRRFHSLIAQLSAQWTISDFWKMGKIHNGEVNPQWTATCLEFSRI